MLRRRRRPRTRLLPFAAKNPAQEPAGGAPRRGTAFGVALLASLLVSAAIALFGQPLVVAEVRAERLPAAALLVTPLVFSLVVVLAALDAWRAARRRGYFSGRALVQLAFAAAFLGLLLPETLAEFRARTAPDFASADLLEQMIKSRDPRVRALVVENAGLRGSNDADVAHVLQLGLDDKEPRVREAARAAVEHRVGRELSGPQGLETARATVRGWVRE